MNGRLRQWWRYPYGVAGPVAMAYLAVGAVVGTVSAVEHMPLLWQLLPGFAVLYLGERVARSATRLYARKRDIPRPPKPSQVRQEASKLIEPGPVLLPLRLRSCSDGSGDGAGPSPPEAFLPIKFLCAGAGRSAGIRAIRAGRAIGHRSRARPTSSGHCLNSHAVGTRRHKNSCGWRSRTIRETARCCTTSPALRRIRANQMPRCNI